MKIHKGILTGLMVLGITVSSWCQNIQNQRIRLEENWKFINTDALEFANPDYNDSSWVSLKVDQTWNKQGFPKYEGFAWYRITVVIPSELKKAVLNDSLIFHLGKIDDFDQVFLNGALIGENLKNIKQGTIPGNAFKNPNHSFWDVPRRYALSVNDPRIKWDQKNVIAIRVFDWGVAGGIYSGNLYLSMPDISEYLQLTQTNALLNRKDKRVNRSVRLFNRAGKYAIKGTLSIRVHNNILQKEVFSKEYDLNLKPKSERILGFNFPQPGQSTTIYYSVRFEQSMHTITAQEGVPYMLTPPEKETPQINGALVYGQRPGTPFLYRIAATGERPMTFSAQGLPAGLSLNAVTGIITGKVEQAGIYSVTLAAVNALGRDVKRLTIKIGDALALTPPMGWNSWNVWGLSVTRDRVYAAARAFVEKGLADHGWTNINIDDGWEIPEKSEQPKRLPNGEIRTNEKFPDMKQLGERIHALGLKFGIYSSPGPLTCGGYTGSYQYEQQDARTFAEWGIDYLKYDLCTYRNLMSDPNDPKELIPPYQKMNRALRNINRDIVYSICEYGNGNVWEWGKSVGGQLWRTTGDIWDDWDRLYQIGFGQTEAAPYAGPGHWNDPDMLVVGKVGWGPNLHQTRLTPDEQYTHVSLWALLSAPLLLGNDLEQLDDFTLNLITNDEVIAIDQDALGNQAIPVVKKGTIEVWKKKLADGNMAVGIFNISKQTASFSLSLKDLGIKKAASVRDLWRQRDLGYFKDTFNTIIPAHGVTLVKIR